MTFTEHLVILLCTTAPNPTNWIYLKTRASQ